uniref:Uncharacterized protein orf66 n=1 Tax=Monomastix sp. (strain OKE-1) TaxID=141716 RepID=C0JWN4_MONSK|nr:hypothetical protein MoOKC_p050 [Monomastix sp. OKE-1]ACK36935.1 unknown [Monomastix sp. OKE-1]
MKAGEPFQNFVLPSKEGPSHANLPQLRGGLRPSLSSRCEGQRPRVVPLEVRVGRTPFLRFCGPFEV